MSDQTRDLLIEKLPFYARFSLRCRVELAPELSQSFKVPLPTQIGQISKKNKRQAICLGPDEWMIFCDESEGVDLVQVSTSMSDDLVHSLVDVSHREIGLCIEGAQAKTLLSMFCARDLAAMEVGSGARTLLDSASAIILKDREDRFQIYVWRSFYPHVCKLLDVGEAELALGF